jgi:hypothetical protein
MEKNTVFLLVIFLLINIITSQQKKDKTKIINNFDKKDFPNEKNYNLKTLAYITPWNKIGYEYIEKYSNKFDIISPTWFELKPDEIDGELQIILDGSNNIDSAYMKKLRSKNKNILILPRLHVGFSDMSIIETWFTKEAEQFIKVLERRIKYNKFDGYVFDCFHIWFNKNLLNKFVKYFLPKIYESMNKLNKIFILTMIPKNLNVDEHMVVLDKNTFKTISNYAHYINIMTYDYQQYLKESSNIYIAPISWIKDTLDTYIDKNDKNVDNILKKILLGIPFHGQSFQKSKNYIDKIINGPSFSQLMKNSDQYELNYFEEEDEYIFESEQSKLNYPIKNYIEKDLKFQKN